MKYGKAMTCPMVKRPPCNIRTGPPRSTDPYPQLSMTSGLGGRVVVYGTNSNSSLRYDAIRFNINVVTPPMVGGIGPTRRMRARCLSGSFALPRRSRQAPRETNAQRTYRPPSFAADLIALIALRIRDSCVPRDSALNHTRNLRGDDEALWRFTWLPYSRPKGPKKPQTRQ